MDNKIFAYMRISTNHKTQKVDRQQQTIIEYSVINNLCLILSLVEQKRITDRTIII